MKKVCIIANSHKDAAKELVAWLPGYFSEHGVESSVLWEDFSNQFTYDEAVPEHTDCAVVLGGDGTMIRVAARLAKRRIPVFGINLGHLGFLAVAELNGVKEAVDQLLLGQYGVEERLMLDVFLNGTYFDTALNDVVITRSGFSRIISVGVQVNEVPVFMYQGDGVIVSTPTGSTGYNLSAGGPVVIPTAQAIILSPICSHSLNSRGIVLTAGDEVAIEIGEGKKNQEEEAILTVDGWNSSKLSVSDCLEVHKSKETAYFIRLNSRSFFELLQKKLCN